MKNAGRKSIPLPEFKIGKFVFKSLQLILILFKFRNQCFCGNESPPDSDKIAEEDCNEECAGNSEEMCGGSWRMNIYALEYSSVPDRNNEKSNYEVGTAVLYSPDVSMKSERCVNVWLQMFGDGDELSIYQMENSASDSAVLKWSRRGSRSESWENTMYVYVVPIHF